MVFSQRAVPLGDGLAASGSSLESHADSEKERVASHRLVNDTGA